jgi:hypothetical protein
MNRQFYLDLAGGGLRWTIGTLAVPNGDAPILRNQCDKPCVSGRGPEILANAVLPEGSRRPT